MVSTRRRRYSKRRHTERRVVPYSDTRLVPYSWSGPGTESSPTTASYITEPSSDLTALPWRYPTSSAKSSLSSDYPSFDTNSSWFSTPPTSQPQSMSDPMYDQPTGPSWRVPIEQYRLIKKHILGKRKKPTTKKKAPAKRRYTRSRGTYRSGSTGGMGPIVITGRGGYFTDKLKSGASAAYRSLQRQLPAGSFERFGTAAGGAMFGAGGAALGGMAGRGIAALSGFGAYTIRKNDLLQLDEGMQVASFGDMNHGVIISHREYIKDISQTTAFTLLSLPINPGLPQSFPWLSQIAPNFDQYQILGMVYHFRSTAGEFGQSGNMAMGSVIMASDYDSADNNYTSKLEMENAQYSTSCKPSVDCIHAIECDPNITFAPIKYVRSGGVPSGKDIRLYDHANFQIATTGMPTTTGAIGELWCTYKIAFFKPQLTNGTNLLTDWFTSATATTTSYWGSNATRSADSSIGCTVVNNTLTFPGLLSSPLQDSRIGRWYYITWSCSGVSAVLTNGMALAASDGTVTIPTGGQLNSGATAATQFFSCKFLVTGTSPTLSITAGTLPTTPTVCSFIVTVIDTDVGDDI